MRSGVRAVVLSMCSLLGLAGCGSQSYQPQNIETRESRPVNAAAEAQAADREQQRIMHLLQLLDQADQALAAKRLTTPLGDNAYLYYQQVLQLMPTNEEAHQGLATIVDRYLQWSDRALRNGNRDQAAAYVDRAAQVLPEEPRVAVMQKRIAKAPVAKPVTADDPNFFPLDANQLSNRSAELQQQLVTIADRIYQLDARVQIQAPNDQSGRWLYLQLNNRHEEYRVRANLKIGRSASIKLLN